MRNCFATERRGAGTVLSIVALLFSVVFLAALVLGGAHSPKFAVREIPTNTHR